MAGDGLGAVLGVTHPVVDEAEALAALDAEGFGVVGHDAEAIRVRETTAPEGRRSQYGCDRLSSRQVKLREDPLPKVNAA